MFKKSTYENESLSEDVNLNFTSHLMNRTVNFEETANSQIISSLESITYMRG